MKSSIPSVTKSAVLAAAFLLGSLVPGYALDNSATPIGAGQALGGYSPAAGPRQAPSVSLQFYLVQLPDGSLNGKAKLSYEAFSFILPSGATVYRVASSVEVKLKSYVFKDGALNAEGLITSLTGEPHFGPAFLFPPDGNQVGDTIFFQVYDLGNGKDCNGKDKDAFIEGCLPAFFGSPDMNTIIAILAYNLGGDGVSPIADCRQVIHGNFEVGDDD